MIYNYLLRKSDNLSRLFFFESVAKLVHKNRAGQKNCQNSFISKLYSFAYFFSHAAHSDQVKRTFCNQRLPVINVIFLDSLRSIETTIALNPGSKALTSLRSFKSWVFSEMTLKG